MAGLKSKMSKKKNKRKKTRSQICLRAILHPGSGRHKGQDKYSRELKKAPQEKDWE